VVAGKVAGMVAGVGMDVDVVVAFAVDIEQWD
jgi:hypothetical protein